MHIPVFQPARPPMQPGMGSTPNLIADRQGYAGQHWSSPSHMPPAGMGYNTIAGHSPWTQYNYPPGMGLMPPYSHHSMYYPSMQTSPHYSLHHPANTAVPSSSSLSQLPTNSMAGPATLSYVSSPANPPPLGYIVAYTPEQLADLMRDHYQVPPSSPSAYSTAGGNYYRSQGSPSPCASPKRPLSTTPSQQGHMAVMLPSQSAPFVSIAC